MKYNKDLFEISEKCMEYTPTEDDKKFKILEKKFICNLCKYLNKYLKIQITNDSKLEGILRLCFDSENNYNEYKQIYEIKNLGKARHFEEEYNIFIVSKTDYDLYVTPSYTIAWNYKEYFDNVKEELPKQKIK